MSSTDSSVTVAAPAAASVSLAESLRILLIETCGQSAVDKNGQNLPLKALSCGLWLHLTQGGADQSPVLDFFSSKATSRETHILRIELVGKTEAKISENARGRQAQMRRDDFLLLHGQAYQIASAFFFRTLP